MTEEDRKLYVYLTLFVSGLILLVSIILMYLDSTVLK